MTAGDRVQSYLDREIIVTRKTATAITKGDVLCYDTSGYAAATIALWCANKVWPLVVALETVAAAASATTLHALRRGVVEINALATVPIEKNMLVQLSTTAGKIGKMCPLATWTSDAYLVVGEAHAAKASLGTTCVVVFNPKL
jgi:hypothetical protein